MAKVKLIDFLEKIGFQKYHSGGGCMSMKKHLNDDPEGPEILITDEEGVSIDVLDQEVEEGQKIWIVFYDEYDAGTWITFECTVMRFDL